ncbi:MAG: DUF2723 domain-containing protein [Ignavibacteriales bacterium]|nr:DUF2723 domain-containing protein [Ignavibacteriales bacterium]MCB9219596.1 DUF2723 domain-containing protein [Ignavibacteriales bacterium]
MNTDTLRKVIGFFVFMITSVVYFATVQPSVSFWDCGEFIASSNLLQVPHPPGTPFFLILGRFFSMIPFADNLAFRVNTISVVSSAFTVLFLYLVAIKIIENFKKSEEPSFIESLGTYFAAAIGALSLAFSDTFWFNAMEAEVYALANFFIAFVTWLMVVWNEKADNEDNEKYLLLIAYLVGLSTGVHLMSVLAMVPIVLVIYARKYMLDEEHFKKTAYIFLGHVAVILAIAAALWASAQTNPPSPEEQKAFDSKFLMISLFASVVYMGIFYKKLFHRNSFYIPIIIGGIALFATYPGIVKYIIKLVALLGGNDITQSVFVLFVLIGVLGYLIYWSNKQNKQTLHLIVKSILFAIVGFSSYAMIIIRSNQDTPINLNSPKTFPEFVKYMNREQYGDQPIFKRRFTAEPHQTEVYSRYSSDLDFFWRYQMNHMFNRYLLWNYVGRESTIQDSGVDLSQLFAVPFIIALFGLFYHYQKDWKMATVFLIMFIFLGYLTAFYQNQQQPQPRERDYFYVGAFFVFSIWVALGIRGILDMIKTSIKSASLHKPAYIGLIAVLIVLIPINMLRANYFQNDRSRNFVPWDYSYNILQSAAPNAVIFTNGDNDTFPLWYLQDVEGVRRDVRIANLSLLNTDWYIKQLKNTEPHGAAKIKMSLSDEQIDRIAPSQWQTRKINVNIEPETYAELGITDTATINTGQMSWNMEPTVNFGNIKAVRAQDIVAMDIVRSNINDRPIYFAVTTPDNSKIGLDDYLQMEGLAFRVIPKKTRDFFNAVDADVMWKQLMEEPEGFSKDYAPGFKFRGLSDSTIFMDDNHERLTLNYRNSFIRLSYYYLYVTKDIDKAVQVLDKMEEQIPRHLHPMDYRLLNDVANRYFEAGQIDTYRKLAKDIEAEALRELEMDPNDFSGNFNPYFVLKQVYDNLKEYDKFLGILQKLKTIAPNDPTVDRLINEYTKLSASKKLEAPEVKGN